MVRRVKLAGLIGAAATTFALAAATGAAGRPVTHSGILIPKSGTTLPRHGGTAHSLNWSGYATTPGGGVTAVNSQFVVPRAGLFPTGFAANWTGIGGYSSTDLIQAGTGENSLPSNPILGPQYFAWYEILPAAETPISGCSGDPNCTVTPSDHMTVNIHAVGGDTWSISMSDAGKWSWSKNITYVSSHSSAEWILEAPTLVAQTILAPVGRNYFGGSTYTVNGATKTISQGNPTKIILSPSPVGGINEAAPSALGANGASFNDCAYAQSCPTP